MNTNPDAKRILCFGDSNTYGAIPAEDSRYPANVRWTGILQDQLGDDYEVIEEGLRGRTTNVDDLAPGYEDKNGADYLFPCVRSQVPLDVVIIMLGTNDFKKAYGRTAKVVAEANRGLVKTVRKYADTDKKKVQIILMSPSYILDFVTIAKPHFAGSPEKSRQLATELGMIAKEEHCVFIDISKFAFSSEKDGLHLTKESHRLLAEKLANKIKEVVSEK